MGSAAPFAFLVLALCGALEPGIYVWDGVHSGVALNRAAALSAQAGFRAIRLVLSPVSRRTYGLAGERATTMSAVFESEAVQTALNHAELRTVMFTAYDFASYPNQRYLNQAFLAANRERIFNEYEQLTEDIMRRESGSGRTFVIGHWEGDNQIYCGSSYSFLVNDTERNKCLESNPAERLAGLIEWLKIRQEAIATGRTRALKAGASHVEVMHAVEFNSLFHFRGVPGSTMRQKDYRGVLDTAVPLVKPDLCSYSSWESLNPNRLSKDLKLIVNTCAPARVIIGELGYQSSESGEDRTKDYQKAIASVNKFRDRVKVVYFWEAYQNGFGVFGEDGQAIRPDTLKTMINVK